MKFQIELLHIKKEFKISIQLSKNQIELNYINSKKVSKLLVDSLQGKKLIDGSDLYSYDPEFL